MRSVHAAAGRATFPVTVAFWPNSDMSGMSAGWSLCGKADVEQAACHPRFKGLMISYCVPSQGAQDAVPKPPNGPCPWGWTSSGSFCLRSSR